MKTLKFLAFFLCISIFLFSCKTEKNVSSREKLLEILQTENLSTEGRFSVINQLSQSMLNSNDTDDLILFLIYTSDNLSEKILCSVTF